jgi:hypothetical protein
MVPPFCADELHVVRFNASPFKSEMETLIRAEPWDDLRYVVFEDPGAGGRQAHLPALAAFGVLGVAARKNVTLITVDTPMVTSSSSPRFGRTSGGRR